MKILSLYWGLYSGAALYIDGKTVSATLEERFTRKKKDDAFPLNSIEFCLKQANIKPNELDGVASASLERDYFSQLTRQALWGIEDYLKQQKEYWFPLFYKNKKNDYEKIFDYRADRSQHPKDYWSVPGDQSQSFSKDVERLISETLGIDAEKVHRIEHHRAHAYYSYYASSFRNENILSFTIDGHGDGLNATIGLFNSNGTYKRIYKTNQCNIARIYRYTTLLLGMMPNEHEYKVMGLAPYGKEELSKKALDLFKNTLFVDGIDFKWKIKPDDSYFWFKERLEGVRFDSIAYSLQEWVEKLTCEWVRNSVRKFGVDKIVISGGVAMNVKAMGKIAELPEVKDLFVGGSSGDESMAISSGICLAEDLTLERGEKWNAPKLIPFSNLFLGPCAGLESEKQVVEDLDKAKYQILENPLPEQLASLLVDGKVIARCSGPMEFGQRALGNRSILADPVNIEIKDRINAMIKNRDFWMPFAPVILDTYAERYLINPKKIQSPVMTIAFKTTVEGFKAMISACHPADKTARPQILKEKDNPELYAILQAFEKLTDRGALLNTSFNLHGHPIVNTPEEGVSVLQKSGLDGLVLENYLILKCE